MRKIRFIDRPEVLDPCPDCGAVEVCRDCRSDIAQAVHAIRHETGDLFPAPSLKGVNWYGEPHG